MAAFNKFETFAGDVGLKVHDLNVDTIEVYLSNATPSASADSVKADLAEITNENGYTAPEDVQNGYTESGGIGTLTGVDVTITAAGGTVGPFRYVVLQNTTPTSPLDPLIGWWDYGSSITLNDGESFTTDFGASILTLA